MKTSVRQLTFEFDELSVGYIDVAQCLSLVNRRKYSQGQVYLVESFSWSPDVATHSASIRSIPTSWIAYNAWVKAKALWNKMNRQTGIEVPKWHDFKVLMDLPHYLAATNSYSGAPNFLPRDGGGSLYSSANAEWKYSIYVDSVLGGAAPSKEHAAHMMGDDSVAANGPLGVDGSNAIIQMYGDTRVTVGLKEPPLPADASASWATDLFDTGETVSDIVEHLESDGDDPPYAHGTDIEAGSNPIYPGGSESAILGHHLATLAGVGVETVYAPGGEVPCGLLGIAVGGGGALQLNVAPGEYLGVAAMGMSKVET